MKKILFPVILGLILIVGIGVYTQRQKTSSVDVENILPAHPAFYMRVQDLSGKVDRFGQTKFWQGLTSINYVPILKGFNISDDDVVAWQKLYTQIMSPENTDLLKKFFGKDFAVVVYPTSFEELSAQALLDFTSNIYVVTKLNPDVQFMEFFSGVFSRFQKNVTTQTMSYKKHTITFVVTNEGIKLGYVRIKDFLVLGVGDRAARAAIDILTDPKTVSLSKDPGYLSAKATFLDKADSFGYLNIELIADSMKKQMLKFAEQQGPERGELIKKQFENSFQYIQGFKGVGFSSLHQDMITSKVDVHYNKNEINPDVRALYQCTPDDNKTLAFTPQTAIGYQWNNCYNLKFYWEQAKKDMTQAVSLDSGIPSAEQRIADLEKSMGLSVEKDILPALGNEVGGFLTDIQVSSIFPLPQMAVFLSIADQAKAQKMVETLVAKQPLVQPQVEKYKDIDVHYVKIPLMEGLEPSYAFIGNYLTAATSRDPLKQAIDVFKNAAPAITSKPGFQQAGQGLTEKSNTIFYLQFDEFVSKLENVINWTEKWEAGEDAKREAFKKGSEQRLADLKTGIAKNEKDLKAFDDQLAAINTQIKQAATVPVPAPVPAESTVNGTPSTTVADAAAANTQLIAGYMEKRKAIEAKISAAEQEINTSQDKIKSLEISIASYEKDTAGTQDRKVVIEHLLRPLAQIFSSIKSFATKMLLKENMFESYFYLRLE